ncbi:unnamed protein product [Paramecium pentaurelia]|uniref:Uncharacterized protein n=1 Tax=Paramecium pentaurelia TaxID=43138 RepID=A0A8S1YQC6_9CILI|nr:unnamed protein product [Paramecium pentaurelia]
MTQRFESGQNQIISLIIQTSLFIKGNMIMVKKQMGYLFNQEGVNFWVKSQINVFNILNILKFISGSSDERGNGFKSVKWIDLDNQFYRSQFTFKEITYDGNYQNGKKVGRWDIWLKVSDKKQKKKMFFSGGGSYDKGGNGIKQGTWVENYQGFNDSFQVMKNGDYQNGKKIGIWLLIDLNENKKL